MKVVKYRLFVTQDLNMRKHNNFLVKTDLDILSILNLNRNHELITENPAVNYRSTVITGMIEKRLKKSIRIF